MEDLKLPHRRESLIESDDEPPSPTSTAPPSLASSQASRLSQRKSSLAHARPRPPTASSRATTATIPHNLLPSAPASPPTPAPSPTPNERAPSWNDAGEEEDAFLRDTRSHFSTLDGAKRQRFLAEVLNLCDLQQLRFVHSFVSPRLKRDPFSILPNELCLRILSFVDDPKTLARASQVSTLWRELLSDDLTWKNLCERHAYRRLSDDAVEAGRVPAQPLPTVATFRPAPYTQPLGQRTFLQFHDSFAPPTSSSSNVSSNSFDGVTYPNTGPARHRPAGVSYKSHFKQRYMVETAWRHGGRAVCHHITPDQGVVTSLHLTPKYIVVALDNAKIHVFNTNGDHQRTLHGHVMGVWAMIPWGDTLVSGGCDRDVRVWDMMTGESKFVLRGHTSTVRCLKMSADGLAISGSRDTTLRVWDINTGVCRNVLIGHQASVRCLEVHDDLVVSGSYDTTAKIWSISQGRCLKTLTGHFSQIYAIAFDGNRIATGSLDTSVRVWDVKSGQCLGVLQGHISLVGQLQMRGDTLVTGGSDGSVRVWSMSRMAAIHRLAAHDNSVTSLQFDDVRVVSGGSDGRVKVWDLKTGHLVRDLSTPADAVWRVAFEEEKAVIMVSRGGRTMMEVWSFAPQDEAAERSLRASSPASCPDGLPTDDRDGDTNMSDAADARSGSNREAGMGLRRSG